MVERAPPRAAASGPREPFLPRRVPIEAYGNGGFRFGGMSHKGSILCLPSGVHGWNVESGEDLRLADLEAALDELAPPGFLLLGTGATQIMPALELRRLFLDRKIGLEPMSTGAAARTFNVLLAESRPVAAALIAVA